MTGRYDPKVGAAAGMGGASKEDTSKWLDVETQDELRKLTAREEAKRLYRIQQAGQKPAPWSKSLAQLLAEPDNEPTYRIEGLWPTGGNIVFSAQYKTGKTTMIGNVLRVLADGDRFLRSEDAKYAGYENNTGWPIRGLEPGQTVFLADIELDERTIRRWLRGQRIRNKDRIRTASFRGRLDEFDILNPDRRDEWAQAFKNWAVRVLIIDPIGPLLATYGYSENSNEDLAKVFAAIDALTAQAGVEEVMVVITWGTTANAPEVEQCSEAGPTRNGDYSAKKSNQATNHHQTAQDSSPPKAGTWHCTKPN